MSEKNKTECIGFNEKDVSDVDKELKQLAGYYILQNKTFPAIPKKLLLEKIDKVWWHVDNESISHDFYDKGWVGALTQLKKELDLGEKNE